MELSIDPGTNGTGWALWERGTSAPHLTGIITPTGDHWDTKPLQIMAEFESIFRPTSHQITHVYLEYPTLMQSLGGQVTAKSGALVKLAYLVGYLSAGFTAWIDADVRLITVNEWKGQLPKSLVQKRIERILGLKACQGYKSHVWDAVGIGLYAKGRFK